MPDASDILKDPTTHLERALHQAQPMTEAVDRFLELHRHMLAGGRPPRQWIEEGTAVGKMLHDEQVNLGHFRFKASKANTREEESAYLGNAEATADAIRAVTGEG